MENIQNYQILWFVLVLILFVGYSLLDGFDLGVGVLLPFLGKTKEEKDILINSCLLYTSPSPRDRQKSRMPSSA